jgi:hypothetical protein
MGAPAYSILSKIYLQFLEHKKIINTLIKYQIIGYFRYVDHILLIHKDSKTDININIMLGELNNVCPKLQFTTTTTTIIKIIHRKHI